MELILFRLLQLLKRELRTFGTLESCLAQQHQLIADGNSKSILQILENEKRLIDEICMIERDKQEEMTDLAQLVDISTQNLTLTKLLQQVEPHDKRSCGIIHSLKSEMLHLLEALKATPQKHKRYSDYYPAFHTDPRRTVDEKNGLALSNVANIIAGEIAADVKIIDMKM
ncbi:flagellar export chaperone FlgN [candidate division KSB1 bacterium]|nr:flagellar export chaperone FlgN [candidate division KSB1 bacterium]